MSGTMDNFSLPVRIVATLTKALDLDTPVDPLVFSEMFTLSNGTGSGQVSQMFHDTRTLNASASEALDLYGGLTNAFGVTINFARLKFVFIRAKAANTNSVEVTRTATTGAPLFMADGDGISLAPGEVFMYFSPTTGKAITDSSDDTLTFTNSAGSSSVAYDIILVGTD